MKILKKILCEILAFAILAANSGCKDTPEIDETKILKPHCIIPLPSRVKISGDIIRIPAYSKIFYGNNLHKAGEVIVNAFREEFGLEIGMSSNDSSDCRIIMYQDDSLEKEEYSISAGLEKLHIKAGSPKAAFYAAQTFRQILWRTDFDSSANEVALQLISVTDNPKNEYRGFHIDLSRHMFSKEFIFSIIDQMSLYKLNKLQLHLTDDQGWRIQIDRYPQLTAVGGFRAFNKYDRECQARAVYDADYNFDPDFVNGNIYGGYYTKNDIREIVAYAGENFIDVIPEIDMPGHMSAAIMSIPELALSCSGNTDWGDEFSEPLCVCRPEVMDFVKNVWEEILDLFPYEYVHIGADEVDKSFWANSIDCIGFMNKQQFSHVNQLQSFFVEEMRQFLNEHHKKIIAWDDVMVSNNDDIVNEVDSSILIMYWRDYKPESSIYAAQNGNHLILSPWSWFYLSSEANDVNLKNLYNFDEKSTVSPEVSKMKIGFQVCVWTEHIPSVAIFERQIYPRLQAYSEVAWSNPTAWDSFTKRMPSHLQYLENHNIKYTKSGFFHL